MKTVKAYFVGSALARDWLNSQISNIEQLEIVGESDCADKAGDEIIQLQPHVVIHATDVSEGKDYFLLQKIKAKYPETYYIVVGNATDFTFRVRYSSAGADVVLNLLYERTKIHGILLNMIATHKSMNPSSHDRLHRVNDLNNRLALNEYFSLMDEYPESLMFADQNLVLRHLNSATVVELTPLETLLPFNLKQIVGQSLGIFHRQRSISTKIASDPRNLPYSTQIIIGPKTFDLEVNSVYDASHENRAGVIARWMERASD